MYEEYGDKVGFMVIYLSEAHPEEKWWLGETKIMKRIVRWANPYTVTDLKKHTSMKERRWAAARCRKQLLGDIPIYVDTMDDFVNTTYAGQPTRMYLIGRDGKVEYDSGLGPWGVLPRYLDAAVREYMGMEPRTR
jgi:hypothetical protein